MTRKDYELIARTIRGLTINEDDRRYVAKCFAADLATDSGFNAMGNRRFDTDKFLKACDAA